MPFNFKKIKFIRKLFGIKTKKEKEIIDYRSKIDSYFIRFLSVEDLNNEILLKSLYMYMMMNLKEDSDNIEKENAFLNWKRLYRKS